VIVWPGRAGPGRAGAGRGAGARWSGAGAPRRQHRLANGGFDWSRGWPTRGRGRPGGRRGQAFTASAGDVNDGLWKAAPRMAAPRMAAPRPAALTPGGRRRGRGRGRGAVSRRAKRWQTPGRPQAFPHTARHACRSSQISTTRPAFSRNARSAPRCDAATLRSRFTAHRDHPTPQSRHPVPRHPCPTAAIAPHHPAAHPNPHPHATLGHPPPARRSTYRARRRASPGSRPTPLAGPRRSRPRRREDDRRR
jgi:hypothetical protein